MTDTIEPAAADREAAMALNVKLDLYMSHGHLDWEKIVQETISRAMRLERARAERMRRALVEIAQMSDVDNFICVTAFASASEISPSPSASKCSIR